jgi:hypothetical protein
MPYLVSNVGGVEESVIAGAEEFPQVTCLPHSTLKHYDAILEGTFLPYDIDEFYALRLSGVCVEWCNA